MPKSKYRERQPQGESLDQKFISILEAINNLSQNMQKMHGRMGGVSDKMQDMKTDLQRRMKDLSDKMQDMKTDLLSRIGSLSRDMKKMQGEIETLSEEVRFIKTDMQKMQYRIDDLSSELQDIKRDMQGKIDVLSRRIAHNASVLKSINLRETFGLSLLLSPGQQASIGVSGFDIE